MQQRGLSAATIAQVRSVLGSALRQAVGDGLITANPVAAVKRPTVQRREPHWPTSAQLGALLEACHGSVWEVPMLLAAVTGARRSEILGISWADVDLKVGTIFIRRGVQPVRHPLDGNTIVFTPLKTKRSRRQVQLPVFALERIRRHRREQLKRRTALGPRWRDPVGEREEPLLMVCDRGDGFPLYPDAFTRAFKRLACRAGMHPATRLHDVRHAVATELGRRGVHPVIVSAVLGHASPAFTIAVYQHVWEEGLSEAAAALQAALHPSRALAIGWHTGLLDGPNTERLSQRSRSEAWTQYPLMRTTLLGSNLGFRPQRSAGTMAARRFPPGSFTVSATNAGIKRISATTRQLWVAWNAVASGGRGATKRSSERLSASDGSAGTGPHRRTSVRPMVSRDTGRCGAGSALSGQQSNSLGLKVRGSRENRTAGGPKPDRWRTESGSDQNPSDWTQNPSSRLRR